MFKNVIVKSPGKSYLNGLTTSDLGTPNYELLLEQHAAYIEALKTCGVEITHLSESEEYPDSTFVEDAAVLTPEFAMITNPGAKSRNGEKEEIEAVLKNFYTNFHYITAPGTLDGGDVLQVDKHFYVGISERTDRKGAEQFKTIVESEGYKATIVELQEFFHLKTGIAYLGNNTVVAAGEFLDHPDFVDYEKVEIPATDEYSANCIKVNDYVIIPKGFEETKRKFAERGIETIELEMSEFQKHDGGLSCLSLRF
ncbi:MULTISPECIES: arginine deiminase family protein [Planococcus]|uniref:N(G),N(G)-dimethylarginine dimethylaminohydrolase n=1 Tax=Planococcus faecalis TaxID=1598147 RepID=A0ABN4XPF1_9BACL|nr:MULTISPECIES: arginine deiminase family protein [Planococcus]AQU80676.1 N(G),N(G)-dimethylarginine dimethylaminohydrolase [Planococcus faecalis]MDJ0333152.1 arginine deiminase family protein [Planococcus sp. S3-L1]OHX55673.1 N(G),N(G)-dimethylarginine dimethylaminohydrolase [Planococcus faecalis]